MAGTDDELLADYAHLREPGRRAAIERQRGIFVVEGRRSLESLVGSGLRVRSVLVAAEKAPRVGALASALDAPVLVLPRNRIVELSGVDFHRGLLAAVDRPPERDALDLVRTSDRLLVLEGVNDHENLGALFRNAAALGADGVVLDPTTADPLYRRVVRVSLGHVLHVPFARVPAGRWPGVLEAAADTGIATLALTPAADAVDLGAWAPDERREGATGRRLALVVGAEGAGLTGAAMAACTERVRIPMAAGVDSLNVATAAAIAMYRVFSPGAR